VIIRTEAASKSPSLGRRHSKFNKPLSTRAFFRPNLKKFLSASFQEDQSVQLSAFGAEKPEFTSPKGKEFGDETIKTLRESKRILFFGRFQ
jgi:hypothetical protein